MCDTPLLTHLNKAVALMRPPGFAFASMAIPERADFSLEAERLLVCQASEYRQREFYAGRECAREALAKLGCKAGVIGMSDADLPEWPVGYRASISHSRGICGAVAAPQSLTRALGFDLEKTNRLSPAAIKKVTHPFEADFVQGEQKAASLLFSAKEAFYKLQFPVWHTFANFQDLALGISEEAGGFRLSVSEMGNRFPADLRALAGSICFRGCFFDDFVASLCWIKL